MSTVAYFLVLFLYNFPNSINFLIYVLVAIENINKLITPKYITVGAVRI